MIVFRTDVRSGRVLDSRMASLRARNRGDIGPVEKKKIISYLENPVSCGLWHLRSTWIKDSGISADIWLEVEKETNGKDFVTIRSGKRERKIKANEEWKNNLREEVQSKLSHQHLIKFL